MHSLPRTNAEIQIRGHYNREVQFVLVERVGSTCVESELVVLRTWETTVFVSDHNIRTQANRFAEEHGITKVVDKREGRPVPRLPHEIREDEEQRLDEEHFFGDRR